MSEPVGFIGLLRAAYAVTVYDSNDSAARELQTAGAVRAHSPAAVASAARVVLASLPTPQVVLDVVSGTNGIRDGSAVRRARLIPWSSPRRSARAICPI